MYSDIINIVRDKTKIEFVGESEDIIGFKEVLRKYHAPFSVGIFGPHKKLVKTIRHTIRESNIEISYNRAARCNRYIDTISKTRVSINKVLDLQYILGHTPTASQH